MFLPDRSSSVTIDWQKIRIQEIDTEHNEVGRIPRTVECELTRDLVECCVPGDQITVCGIAKVISADQNQEYVSRASGKNSFTMYVDCNSVSNSKQVEQGYTDIMKFGPKDMQAIMAIARDPDPFNLIINSLCPAIFGHDIVKAGLAMCIFGGCHKFTKEKDKLTVRGDPHMLVVGDPGLGKSQLLNAVALVAPRGIYVCGNTTSTSGLTVTVVRDAQTGDFSLEAGALVLADQGVCCIDEFDKMRNEHQALLEAMEQQTISIAKAGIVCSLPSRCSVIAAANPIGGHYKYVVTICNMLVVAKLLEKI